MKKQDGSETVRRSMERVESIKNLLLNQDDTKDEFIDPKPVFHQITSMNR